MPKGFRGFQPGERTRHQGHRGWDLYNRKGDIRCLLRFPHKCPATEYPDRPELPAEVVWPVASDWDSARRYLDALIEGQAEFLEEMARLHPNHRFGHDAYLLALSGRVLAGKPPPGASPNYFARVHLVPTAAKDRRRLTVTKIELTNGVDVVLDLVHWDNRQTTFDLRVLRGKVLLTRVIIDASGRYELLEHRPGRYRGFGLDPLLYRRFLDLGRATRERARDTGHERSAGLSPSKRLGTMSRCSTSPASIAPSTASEPSSGTSALSCASPSSTGGSPSPPASPSTPA